MDEIANRFIAGIYDAYYRKFYILAYSILGKQAEAEVAVQEAFVVACQQSEIGLIFDDKYKSKNFFGALSKNDPLTGYV